MLRHSVWGMEGYRLATSTAANIASSGMCSDSSVSERDVEL